MVVLATVAPEPNAREAAEIDLRQSPAVEIADRDPGIEILGMLDDHAAIEHGRVVYRQFAFGDDRAPAAGPGIGAVDADQAPIRRIQVCERVMGRSQIADRGKAREIDRNKLGDA